MTETREQRDIPPGMRLIAGGDFRMGSEHFYPEEAPVRDATVGSFLMDETPVTNAQFAMFVAQTNYVTSAEIAPSLDEYPNLPPEAAIAGSSVFVRPDPAAHQGNLLPWWQYIPGAHWRHPWGTDSGLAELGNHPVVHISYSDACVYAAWAGKTLPTEAEWEYAARGGLTGVEYAWGNELAPDGEMLANYWQGEFPHTNLVLDGWERTSPVKTYPANGYGLYDMIGNVWEWTEDWWNLPSTTSQRSCCSSRRNRGGTEAESRDPNDPFNVARKVIKGGSHLCAENYCQRYRPAARHPQAIDTGTSHIGFRCIIRLL